MASTIKITKGQPFVLWIPTIILNADSKVPVDSSTLSNVSVHVSSVCNGVDITKSVNYYEHWIVLGFGDDLIVGPYRVEVTGDLASGRSFCLRMSKPFEIVQWDHESNWRDYLVGDHIELSDQPFIAGEFTTDAEYEALKQQLREQIAAAEQAEAEAIAEKERYAEAIEHLDDIAQESTLTQGVSDIRNDIANIDIDTTTLAKETTAQQAAADAAAAKTAAQGITGYALQGSDQTATNTALASLIGYTIQEIDGV